MTNPFREAGRSLFVAGEPQEESLARIEYLKEQRGGWCAVTGPKGIGKSALVAELARRARRHGEACSLLEWGPADSANWLTLVAQTWNLAVDASSSHLDLRRVLEEHLIGSSALNRPMWLLVDAVDELDEPLTRGCRWLSQAARRYDVTLAIVIACRTEAEGSTVREEADLRLELWPWELDDCGRYLRECCQAAGAANPFSSEAVSLLSEQSTGIPGELAKLAEWSWLAAQTETRTTIGTDLIDAIAEELSPRVTRRATYEVSAAYGAW